jgi:hypothetical protein
MSDEKQKEAARRNIEKAREVQSERAHGADIPRSADGLSTAEKDRLPDAEFAFPAQRKEPLSDAAHVRNAIARFDQVEGVSDEERDQAWQRIRAAAGQYGVHVGEDDWRDLFARSKNEKKQLPSPAVLPFGRRIRHRDGGGHHQAGRGRTGLPGAQCGVQRQPAELEQRERDLCLPCHGPISAGGR